jgi:excisionase family DNA binding protein
MFLSPGQVARRLGVSRTFVYARFRAGELSSVVRGRRRFVAVAELDRWMAPDQITAPNR